MMIPKPKGLASSLANNLLLEAELGGVASALQRERIPYLVLKGIPLSRELEGTLPNRRLADNDLWVPPHLTPSAAKVLRAQGYRPFTGSGVSPDSPFEWQATWIRYVDERPLLVDLHWQVLSPLLFCNPPQLLLHQRTVRVGRRRFPVLSQDATLVQLAAHFVQHFCQERRILRDFAGAWQRYEGSPAQVIQLAERCGARTAVALALHACRVMGIWPAAPQLPLPPAASLYLTLAPLDTELHSSIRAQLLSHLLGAPQRLIPSLINDLFPAREVLERSMAPQLREGRGRTALYARRLLRSARAIIVGKAH